MKKQFLALIILLILPSVLALNLEITKKSSDEVLIIGLEKPVIFNLEVTNNGPSDNLEFYNLAGLETFPKGTVQIGSKETENIELKFSPIGEFKSRGFYNLDVHIRGNGGAEQIQKLTFRVIDLKDVFEISTDQIDPESSSAEIYVENKVNYKFEKIKAEFSSPFFEFEREFALAPNKVETFTIDLNKDDFDELTAGFYTINAEIKIDNKKTNVEGKIEFSEKNIVTASHKDYGIVVSTQIIEKSNQGNLIEETETIVQKNIFSRLFTSFSPEPDIVERNGFKIYYTWNQSIKPGETLKIIVKTNWIFPFIIILLIITVVILVKQYSQANLVLRKKVAFVNAKGGEFALKVSITVHAKKYLGKVNVIDRLPPLARIYRKFGGEEPVKIDEKNRRIEWNFERLEAGETRYISYIIYSKIGVLGRFALPPATAIFEKEGQIKDTQSNRAFFVTEQRGQEIEED